MKQTTVINLSHINHPFTLNTAQKMKFSIKDFLSKRDQIRRNLRIWSHLLKKSSMENFIFCAVKENIRVALNKSGCSFIWNEPVKLLKNEI